ncbi:MAG TPA: VOC family protein [Vicinamibacteria bacterium]|nr:VOC family protein [Vicinamibacteria bacterium]
MAITPYLYYQDVDGTLKFLAKAFGFRQYGAKVRGPDGKTNHAAMKMGKGIIMMGRPASAYRNPRQIGQATQSLYVDVADVDKHFRRAQKAGASILEEPTDTEYGHRRYGAKDPEGHEWYFAHAVRPRRAQKKKSARAPRKELTKKARAT